MEELKQNTEFYKSLYEKEHERSKFFDNSIRFPSTLIVLFFGGGYYAFNNFFDGGIKYPNNTLEWLFILAFGLFCLTTLIATFYLGITFHGFTRKYKYLPYATDLKKHQLNLYKHHYKYSDKTKYSEKRIDATTQTAEGFIKILGEYYADLTTINQKINDKRADNYYLTRTFLFIDLLLLIILGTIEFIT